MTKDKGDVPQNKDIQLPYDINDPMPEATKGRPIESKGSQSVFPQGNSKRKAKDKPRLCKTYKGTGHDSRNCPNMQDDIGGKESKCQKN
ncbi:Zinc finger, CCHC-type [Trema orientale]|uniref:Zinc finger, CCHC-type n=1 Tax=Trema orientale TaxID=63057 RepID=A0A2P5BS61_TREOI|nr:Zinc finger, CCHC-type [Trema orientale]